MQLPLPCLRTVVNLTSQALLDMVLDMTTVTMRELMHNPTGVLRIVEHGGTVRLTRRGRPVARLIPEPEPTPRKLVKVDFMKQLKATWGDKVFTSAEIKAMREAELGDRS